MMKVFPYALAMLISLTACSGNDTSIVSVGDEDNVDNSADNNSDNSNDNQSDNSADNEPDNSVDNEPDNSSDNSSNETSATYRVTFNATWSEANHSLNFPGDPHFSGLVGAVHNEQIQFWMNGQPASAGIKLMAETGGKDDLLTEVQDAINNGYAISEISGGGVSTSPGAVSTEFEVSADYPQVTVVSMVAPSPDWFVGVHNLSLIENGAFVSGRTVELAVYDAGTDSGLRYTSDDLATNPREPIQLLSSAAEDAPFIDGLPVVGQFIFERL